MKRILIVECMQEISSFNPVPSDYAYFSVQRGAEMLTQRGRNTGVGGALQAFEADSNIQAVPVYSARAGSDNIVEILQRDSANRKPGERHVLARPSNIG